MKKVRLAFHLVMLALVALTFAGVFSPAKTGSFAADNTGYIMPLVGVLALWVVGAIVLRIVGGFAGR